MLGRSIPELIFIRTCIIPIHHAPVLWPLLLILNHLLLPLEFTTILTPLFFILTILEFSFYLLVYRPHVSKRLGTAAAIHPPALSRADRNALFRRVLADVLEPEAYLRGWFLGADSRDIRRGNVADFLAWAFFERDAAEVNGEDEEDLDGMVNRIGALLGRKLPPGRGAATALRLTLDPVEAKYRSFLWYLIIGLIDVATHVCLAWFGFQYYAQPAKDALSVFPPRPQQLLSRKRSVAPGMGYWHRPGRPDVTPVVLLHGIGVGLLSYIRLLVAITSRDPDAPVIAVEILPISFRLCPPPLPRPQFLSSLSDVLAAHSIDRFCLVGHSYGTVLATHVVHSPLCPRIESLVLVDPVAVQLHLPDVAVNFTRRPPRTANEWQLWFFASTDPGVAECLARWFFWRDNVLWREDIQTMVDDGKRVAVFLAGKDLILDAWAVHRYLDQVHGVEITMMEKLDHSQVLYRPEQNLVIDRIRELCQLPDV
jgi:pimeloyl-ACP methyl ester carboxylesterase